MTKPPIKKNNISYKDWKERQIANDLKRKFDAFIKKRDGFKV